MECTNWIRFYYSENIILQKRWRNGEYNSYDTVLFLGKVERKVMTYFCKCHVLWVSTIMEACIWPLRVLWFGKISWFVASLQQNFIIVIKGMCTFALNGRPVFCFIFVSIYITNGSWNTYNIWVYYRYVLTGHLSWTLRTHNKFI